MANASKTHMGPASGKGDGSGAMTDESIIDGRLGENMVLSNRDKSRHTAERGLDSKAVQTDQLQDHAASHRDNDATSSGAAVETGVSKAQPTSET